MTIDIEIDMDDNDGAKLIAALNYIMSSLSNIHDIRIDIWLQIPDVNIDNII
jgi:hypothetical protein